MHNNMHAKNYNWNGLRNVIAYKLITINFLFDLPSMT